MMKRNVQILFSILFVFSITLPLVTANLHRDRISTAENRKLSPMAELYNEDGTRNENFNMDFEAWLNDNIGFRSLMVLMNAKLQYIFFDKLADNNFEIGRNGELNFVGEAVIPNYQHTNLLSDEELTRVADSYQIVNDYLEKRGIQFYYIQNWDKQSIYPEEFVTGINQYGDTSLADQVVEALESRTRVSVISMKDILIEGKELYRTYNKWADVSHWSHRGAYLGYQYLMQILNKNNENKFKILDESAYEIQKCDQGATISGGIHKEDYVETFTLKNPTGCLTNEKLTLYGEFDNRQTFWTNDLCGNDTTVLICGDSYMQSFLMDDLAESFYQTIELWASTMSDITTIVEEYEPDIVIYEKAEREPAYTVDIVNAANKILETDHMDRKK